MFISDFNNGVSEQIIPQIFAVISGTPHKRSPINTTFIFFKVTGK